MYGRECVCCMTKEKGVFTKDEYTSSSYHLSLEVMEYSVRLPLAADTRDPNSN